MHQATSCFSVRSSDFDPSGIFVTRDQFRILFHAHFNELNILINARLNSYLDGKYFPIMRLSHAIFFDVEIGFSSNFGFSRRAYGLLCWKHNILFY